MPKIWAETIDNHRQQVNDAILDATAQLVTERGPLSVAMSAVAERAGIGRATLYKYFADVESILVAWHDRTFVGHLRHLQALSDNEDATLEDLAQFVRDQRSQHSTHQDSELLGTLAHGLASAQDVVKDTIEPQIIAGLTAVLTRLVQRHEARDDLDPEVLARWLFHVLHAPRSLDDEAVSQLLIASLARTGKRPARK